MKTPSKKGHVENAKDVPVLAGEANGLRSQIYIYIEREREREREREIG